MNPSAKDIKTTPTWRTATFNHWYQLNSYRFDTPIVLVQPNDSDSEIEITIPRLGTIFSASFYKSGIVVRFAHNGFEFDAVPWFDTYPIKRAGGYVDRLYDPTWNKESPEPIPATIYPNIESIWCEEVFEVFLGWVNKHVAPAKWLVIYAEKETGSFAELHHSDKTICKIIKNTNQFVYIGLFSLPVYDYHLPED
jgi:hypothetical protein